MQRRSFLKVASCAAAASPVVPMLTSCNAAGRSADAPAWSCAGNSTAYETVIACDGLPKPVTVLQITDSHITCAGDSDKEYEQYSARMAGAYAHTKHYKTNQPTTPIDSFAELMDSARKEKVDLIVLTGDIINFPSAADVSEVSKMLTASGIPFIYTAGNHDWHYEGMDGAPDELRGEWCKKRLAPLYGGRNELYSSEILGGINVVNIDNSTYQVNREQLDFYMQQRERPEPIALFMHIPLYMPAMGICCGHPQWGAAADKLYEIERRQRWPESGNLPSTTEFVDRVLETEKLAGIFVGHWHEIRTVTYRGKSQYLTGAACNGQHRMIRFIPLA